MQIQDGEYLIESGESLLAGDYITGDSERRVVRAESRGRDAAIGVCLQNVAIRGIARVRLWGGAWSPTSGLEFGPILIVFRGENYSELNHNWLEVLITPSMLALNGRKWKDASVSAQIWPVAVGQQGEIINVDASIRRNGRRQPPTVRIQIPYTITSSLRENEYRVRIAIRFTDGTGEQLPDVPLRVYDRQSVYDVPDPEAEA
jgi:hypothetical protein